jgi:hypothetical protein
MSAFHTKHISSIGEKTMNKTMNKKTKTAMMKYTDIDWNLTKEITGTEAEKLAAVTRNCNSIRFFKAAWKK